MPNSEELTLGGKYCDLRIVFRGEHYDCHKSVVCSKSKLIAKLVQENQIDEWPPVHTICIDLPGTVTSENFCDALIILYDDLELKDCDIDIAEVLIFLQVGAETMFSLFKHMFPNGKFLDKKQVDILLNFIQSIRSQLNTEKLGYDAIEESKVLLSADTQGNKEESQLNIEKLKYYTPPADIRGSKEQSQIDLMRKVLTLIKFYYQDIKRVYSDNVLLSEYDSLMNANMEKFNSLTPEEQGNCTWESRAYKYFGSEMAPAYIFKSPYLPRGCSGKFQGEKLLFEQLASPKEFKWFHFNKLVPNKLFQDNSAKFEAFGVKWRLTRFIHSFGYEDDEDLIKLYVDDEHPCDKFDEKIKIGCLIIIYSEKRSPVVFVQSLPIKPSEYTCKYLSKHHSDNIGLGLLEHRLFNNKRLRVSVLMELL